MAFLLKRSLTQGRIVSASKKSALERSFSTDSVLFEALESASIRRDKTSTYRRKGGEVFGREK
jgi:hypothetical protein